MTILRTLLTRGYFPKELPPAFYTEGFAAYASTKGGRHCLKTYKPADNYTECVKYRLALPGFHRRELRIAHPASYTQLASLTAEHFQRLLKKASKSPFSKSRPVYATNKHRALQPGLQPANLGRERAALRAGGSFLLKADVSQFYPSLYTHAVGWAIDPKLRQKAYWKNSKLLGKKLDQALMDLDGKVSQGIPIGNDISFLLAEAVLAQVDAGLRVPPERALRWFDDWEITFDSRREAEACFRQLSRQLASFRLRLNPAKTKIIELPKPADEEWQQQLVPVGAGPAKTRDMVKHFDTAFRLREKFPESPVLLYTLGVLFGLKCPAADVGRVAESCLTQAILSEPGAAQKGFALLSYWKMNGYTINIDLVCKTINQLILRHEAGGLSSDVAWALSFCLEQQLSLDAKTAKVLSVFDDDCIALQALHMNASGLLPKGFTTCGVSTLLNDADLDREHWLIAYEAVRHNFLKDSAPAIKDNALFRDLLNDRVTFYRVKLPPYASIVHPGGAPEWVVKRWMDTSVKPEKATGHSPTGAPIPQPIQEDLAKLKQAPATEDDAIAGLLGILDEKLQLEPDVLTIRFNIAKDRQSRHQSLQVGLRHVISAHGRINALPGSSAPTVAARSARALTPFAASSSAAAARAMSAFAPGCCACRSRSSSRGRALAAHGQLDPCAVSAEAAASGSICNCRGRCLHCCTEPLTPQLYPGAEQRHFVDLAPTLQRFPM